MSAFDFQQFRAALDALLPVERAQAVFPALRSLPIGARVGRYVREPGADKWRCEYTSTRHNRAGEELTSHHRTMTSAWSIAMDVGFPSKHREAEIEEIARAAHAVMLAQGLTRLPERGSAEDDAAMAELSTDEAAEIVEIEREAVAPAPATKDDIWRRQYREDMARKRTMGVQPDLFDGPSITHYHRLPRPPAFTMPPRETLAAKLERIKGNPLATFGPPGDRQPLSPMEKEKLLRSAANWLRVGQRVRVKDSMRSVDGSIERRVLGREGVIWRLCSVIFDDHTYVFLDPVRGERSEKVVFIEIRDLEPIE